MHHHAFLGGGHEARLHILLTFVGLALALIAVIYLASWIANAREKRRQKKDGDLDTIAREFEQPRNNRNLN